MGVIVVAIVSLLDAPHQIASVFALEPIAVSYQGPGVFNLPVELAVQRGFFRDQNLDVKLIMTRPDIDRTALFTGDIDYSLRGSSTVLSAARGLPIRMLFVGTLKPFWALVVRPEVGQYLALAVHELATNAVKYGALSNEAGRVDATWSIVALYVTPAISLTMTRYLIASLLVRMPPAGFTQGTACGLGQSPGMSGVVTLMGVQDVLESCAAFVAQTAKLYVCPPERPVAVDFHPLAFEQDQPAGRLQQRCQFRLAQRFTFERQLHIEIQQALGAEQISFGVSDPHSHLWSGRPAGFPPIRNSDHQAALLEQWDVL